MKLIVPMAGRGTRLRPHTHVTPKPLLPVVGRTMVERIVETFVDSLPRDFDEAVFVLGPDFGDEVRDQLTEICSRFGIEASFGVQETAEGTAHAIAQAGDKLDGECVLVFADTLFTMDQAPDLDADAVVWVMEVEDPSRFGVVVKDGEQITDFVEKPETPISNEAIVGIYYVKEGERLGREIQHLMDEDVRGKGGEFQLTDALDRMLKDGATFKTARVTEWLDCGTIPAIKSTSQIVLDHEGEARTEGTVENSQIIDPVFIAEGAVVRDSVVGPYAAVHGGATIESSAVRNTIVFGEASVEGSSLDGSMVGHHAAVRGFAGELNIGDHATVGVES
ncbi:sugar phosphate nucleotidyltransferase [Rubrivirga sp. S365]|uniref:Sugar phosphate nucleotidyltransferase n=1 Tax=Rubrivirga litoralis TaxID=3075598 RepID=A0ABU3BR80_9BACT|nr:MULTISPECIES: sugar phosphate nucleotidyltransferase [unclassified Rubrivirga]MDT0631795.1 sugar phosphate nucleotidyltransferase [Rubrivirga sp. F394]MDT7856513.1 sugar phosphate nucleotidyltransferase [Rubrivirga sp. S365]